MKKLLRNVLPALLLMGVIASCETTSPLIDEAQVGIYTQNFDSAYAKLDTYIAQNPNSGVGYYYKALAYSEEAKTIEPPSDRKPIYRDFRSTIVTSRENFSKMESKPDEAGQVNNLILNTWGREHNASLDYATNDSIMATVENPLSIAVAHLENAIIVNPDSTLSYDVLSQVQYWNNNYAGAADALAKSMELKENPEAADYERLAVYRSNSGEPAKAIEVLEEGLEMYPDSVGLTQQLADNLMTVGERERAIEVLQQLIESEPDNPQYHLVLGTVLLQGTDPLSQRNSEIYDEIYALEDSMRNASGSESEALQQEIEGLQQELEDVENELDDISSLAEEELLKVIELRPDDEVAYNALGIIYQNKASRYFDKRNNTENLEQSNEYDQMAKEFLTKAMEYYEKVVELNPDNRGAWSNLMNVYITLDMPEKAQEAQDKAGM